MTPKRIIGKSEKRDFQRGLFRVFESFEHIYAADFQIHIIFVGIQTREIFVFVLRPAAQSGSFGKTVSGGEMMDDVSDFAFAQSDFRQSAYRTKTFFDVSIAFLKNFLRASPDRRIENSFRRDAPEIRRRVRAFFRQTKRGKRFFLQFFVVFRARKRMQTAGEIKDKPRVFRIQNKSAAKGFERLQKISRKPQFVGKARR